MRKLYEKDGYVLWEYKPTLFQPLLKGIDPPGFVRRMRLLLEYLSKGSYKVYYLEVNGRIVGYNVFARGGRRLKCSTQHDIVSGPSYVLPQYRGRGYIVTLLKLGIKYAGNGFNNVYAWIAKDNISSIKAYQKAGFEIVNRELKIEGIMRTLKETEVGAGSNIIVCYRLQ